MSAAFVRNPQVGPSGVADSVARRPNPDTLQRESIYRSIAELASDIGLSERSTRSAIKRGEIPHIKLGRRIILPRAAIAEWLRSAGRRTGIPEVFAPLSIVPMSGRLNKPDSLA